MTHLFLKKIMVVAAASTVIFISAQERTPKPTSPDTLYNIGIDGLDGVLEGMQQAIEVKRMSKALDLLAEKNPELRPVYKSASFFPTPRLYEHQSPVTLPSSLGRFFRPVPGKATSGFGFRPRFQRMHKGIDLNLAVGDTVRAAFAGVIERRNFEKKGYGNYIVIDHGEGIKTVYAHLSAFIASPGDTVESGSPIALGGNTGRSTGPHLHFEIRVNGLAVNPARYFNFDIPASKIISKDHINSILDFAMQFYPKQLPSDTKLSKAKRPATYIVQKNDYPAYIARKVGIPLSTLCRLNNITEHTILFIGKELKIR